MGGKEQEEKEVRGTEGEASVSVSFCVCCVLGRLCVVHIRSDKKIKKTEIGGVGPNTIS